MSPYIRNFILLMFFIVSSAVDSFAQPAIETLTLDRVVGVFLERSLDIEAARYRVERARADQIAAQLRPNPGLALTAENFKVNGPLPFERLYEVGFAYSETIELGGKRQLRQEVAGVTVSVAEAQLADTLRQRLSEVKRLYYEALLARANVDIATENRDTFEQLLRFNVTRFQEGAIAEGDLIKVRLERMKFDSAVKQAELALTQSVIRLQERLGQADYAAVQIAGNLEFTPINLSLETLREMALSARPDLQGAALEVQLADQRLALERSRNSPDVTPFVGYKRVGSDDTVLFGLSLPLRVRDRNQGGIARAIADGKIAQTQVRLVRNRVLAEVESAFRAYETARSQVNVFRSELLPQADQSRAVTLIAYEEGATELLPVLEAQRTRAEVREQFFRTVFDYQLSLLQLELAVGREIRP
jgi:cobalt-zinc-cadmium efflux system outer membrane protein